MTISLFKIPRSRKYQFRYKDEFGNLRQKSLAKDRDAAESMARKIIKQVARKQAGVVDIAAESALIPIADHLLEFKKHMGNHEVSPRHVEETIRRITILIDLCKFTTIVEICSPPIQEELAKLRKGERFSQTTSNMYVTAFKAFTSWLKKEHKLRIDPLTNCYKQTVTRQVHSRRVLSESEFDAFLESVKKENRTIKSRGPNKWKLTAIDRHNIYLLASKTGLRASEIASLTVGSFKFSGIPTVTIEAKNAKNKKTFEIPLNKGIVPIFEKLCERKSSERILFPGRWNQFAAKMLRGDLKKAGIPYNLDGKFFDFHAIRAQFITSLARKKVPIQYSQKLARHSTINLTSNYYTLLQTEELAAQIDLI